MSEVKHTPGPWFAALDPMHFHSCTDVADGEGGLVASMCGTRPKRTVFEMEANARLIAAAPEMLEALYEAEEYFDNRAEADHDETGFVPNTEMKLLVSIRAAIAKATGSAK